MTYIRSSKQFFPEENVSATAEDKKYEEEITLQFQVEYEPQQIKLSGREKIRKVMTEVFR